MCGKFTSMYSWREVYDFSQPLTIKPKDGGPDEEITNGVSRPLPVIVWDREAKQRRIVPMRWGFPHPKNWRRPQPIHARSEAIDTTKAFANAFMDGQRGIVVFKTFNEGEEVGSKTIQYTIDPQDGIPRGFAFVWRRFEIPELPQPMLACVMATVPASKLIMPITDRMPAILENADWATWLGEADAPIDAVKATLRTMEGVNWKMEKEVKPKKERARMPSKPEKPKKPDPEPSLF